mmetsp:Transcript_4929/g.9230  ORF Transcript_4929/g.9230 Transcript_4929/m.9230 type:complete len:85 (-) Transcript_4929:50-304(-)
MSKNCMLNLDSVRASNRMQSWKEPVGVSIGTERSETEVRVGVSRPSSRLGLLELGSAGNGGRGCGRCVEPLQSKEQAWHYHAAV